MKLVVMTSGQEGQKWSGGPQYEHQHQHEHLDSDIRTEPIRHVKFQIASMWLLVNYTWIPIRFTLSEPPPLCPNWEGIPLQRDFSSKGQLFYEISFDEYLKSSSLLQLGFIFTFIFQYSTKLEINVNLLIQRKERKKEVSDKHAKR